MCLFSASDLDDTSRALLSFLFARYVGIDRYCDKGAWNAKSEPLSSSLIYNVRSMVGRTKETTLPLFDNVPYLKRFRLRDGSFFITSFVGLEQYECVFTLLIGYVTLHSDYYPEPPNLLIEDSTNNFLRDFSVDTMLLGVDAVLWLRIEGHEFSFDATGHYPILTGFNQHGEPLYVAAAIIDDISYFTCVEDGASSDIHRRGRRQP